jgi:diaminopimelate epimerase
LELDGEKLRFSAATIGNPHCVILRDDVDASLAQRLGPKIERLPLFSNRTNVQFMRVIDPTCIQVEIWERGAGYTLASGSSASAAAAVARRLGLCGPKVRVQMPGGNLHIEIGNDFSILLSGPVTKVGNGTIYDEIFG